MKFCLSFFLFLRQKKEVGYPQGRSFLSTANTCFCQCFPSVLLTTAGYLISYKHYWCYRGKPECIYYRKECLLLLKCITFFNRMKWVRNAAFYLGEVKTIMVMFHLWTTVTRLRDIISNTIRCIQLVFYTCISTQGVSSSLIPLLFY